MSVHLSPAAISGNIYGTLQAVPLVAGCGVPRTGRLYSVSTHSDLRQQWKQHQNCSSLLVHQMVIAGLASSLSLNRLPFRGITRRQAAKGVPRNRQSPVLVVTATLNTGGLGGAFEENRPPGDDSTLDVADTRQTSRATADASGTRLGKFINARLDQLGDRWNDVRNRLPLKILLLLLGFFSANAIATVLGQTGDWDVLVAGLLVAILEGVGWLVYRVPVKSPRKIWRFARLLLVLLNYWKAGLIFGLFVDAFKVGS